MKISGPLSRSVSSVPCPPGCGLSHSVLYGIFVRMSKPDFSDPRLTEKRNPRTAEIDMASSLEIVDLMNQEDRRIALAVGDQRVEIARAIDLVVEAFQGGGRLIYVGAGTSGRLGVLDASECPPTFGTDPSMVVGIIAGGSAALTRSQEGAEDDGPTGAGAIDSAGVTNHDVVLGIAASGTTPFVRHALLRALELGAATGLVSCSTPPEDLARRCDVMVTLLLGPEVLTGSTRLKAGTATKMVLNTVTTGAMIRMGKAYGNLMVDLMAMSDKLTDRGERIVMEAGGVSRERARSAIQEAGGSVKLAVVLARMNVEPDVGRKLLAEAGGMVRAVIGEPPSVRDD
jgi:N-acetylmuramic acid 6-phosphate etherase